MHVSIVTLFPEMFQALSEYGISGRAVKTGLITLNYWNPRDFTADKHRTVDDRPYGGGPGMLMKTEPLKMALDAARAAIKDKAAKPKVIYLSPQGKRLDQKSVERLSLDQNLILLCGRYEGIDERIIATEVDEECSIGDFVISGGELAAMVLIDALLRTREGVLGHDASAAEDSFVNGLLDCPHYTRPEVFGTQQVPAVLLSGDHAEIARWRMQQSLGKTWLKRPDLLEGKTLTDEQRILLDEFIRQHQQDRYK